VLRLHSSDGRIRHTEHDQALPRWLLKRLCALRARIYEREVLLLGREPLRREDGGERLPAMHALERCLHVETRHVTFDARLDNRDQSVVEGDTADRMQA